ncbi:MAG: cytochrome c-type biogenesis protein, partial [Thermocrispum sp.]
MHERIRALALPLALVASVAVIVVGLLTAPPGEVDRVDALAARLRCPVCQGESVADSPSDTAVAIRGQIAEFV